MRDELYLDLPTSGSGTAEDSATSRARGDTAPARQGGSAQRSIFEAEALATLEKAKLTAAHFERQMMAAASALTSAKDDRERDCDKVLELHCLVVHRLNCLIRLIGEGQS